MAITATVQTSSSVSEVATNGSTSATFTGGPKLNVSLTSGTGAGMVDKWWEKKDVSLAASATVTYTLSALTDDLGRSVAFARVKDFLLDLVNPTGNTAGDALTVGNAGTNPWAAPFGAGTQTLSVKVGGFLHLVAPGATAYVVASGSSEQLKITNPSSNAVKFTIRLIGCSV